MIHELRPEKGILVIWFFTKCLPVAIFLTFLSFWFPIFLGGALAAKPDGKLAAIGVVSVLVILPIILIIGMIYCAALRSTHIYYVTDQRSVFHGGIFRRVERSVHFHKVTDVETSQNIIEQLLGILTLKIFTPGTASLPVRPFGGEKAEITFVGLKDSETIAHTVNSKLKKLGFAKG